MIISWLEQLAALLQQLGADWQPWPLALGLLAVLLLIGTAIGAAIGLKRWGVPEALLAGGIGLLLAPSGPFPLLPPAVIERLNREIGTIVRRPENQDAWGRMGATALASTPAEYRAMIEAEIEKWARLIRDAKLKLD